MRYFVIVTILSLVSCRSFMRRLPCTGCLLVVVAGSRNTVLSSVFLAVDDFMRHFVVVARLS